MKDLYFLLIIVSLVALVPGNSLFTEEFKGGLIGAWEASISAGPAIVPTTDSFNYCFPVQISGAYKAGILDFWATPFIGIELKAIATNVSINHTHLMIGVSAGLRRFASITYFNDLLHTNNYFIPGFTAIEGSVLLMKYYIKIKDYSGIFFDLHYKLMGFTNTHYYNDKGMHSIVFTITITNECRSGVLGGGMLFFLSPFFWMDAEGYMAQLIWG